MTRDELLARLRDVMREDLPLPGGGQTALRHMRLMELGREDLSLARLAEAHFDALAILAEAGRPAEPGAIYGVWASEKPGQAMALEIREESLAITGEKMFCSGAGLIDRALITVGAGEPLLIDVDLRARGAAIAFDRSVWKTTAFAETNTAAARFVGVSVSKEDIVCDAGWYLKRPGFWHGACGPASCWAGGAAGLVDYATKQKRNDAHTLAHLGAMAADVWALRSILQAAGDEIDATPQDAKAAHRRALTVRHLAEQASSDILRRLPRAYGPHPLAMDETIAKRYAELDLYVRQSHAERDLEALGAVVLS
jgi:hypothetical protein